MTAATIPPPAVAPAPDPQPAPGGDLSRLPDRLSPSRAKDFLDCPYLFYERTILRVPSPSTPQTMRGTLAHAVFEEIFSLPPAERTPAAALAMIGPAWERLTDPDTKTDPVRPSRAKEYRALAPAGSVAEHELLAAAAAAIEPWFSMEKVAAFTPVDLVLPDSSIVDGRELHVEAEVAPRVRLHGFIDRLDSWVGPGGQHWSVTDYKTSARPPGYREDGGQYPEATATRIVSEAFFALRVYALLVHDQLHVTPDRLRLVYTPTGDRRRGIVTEPVTAESVDATRQAMVRLWADICAAAAAGSWPCRQGFRCRDHADPGQAGAELSAAS